MLDRMINVHVGVQLKEGLILLDTHCTLHKLVKKRKLSVGDDDLGCIRQFTDNVKCGTYETMKRKTSRGIRMEGCYKPASILMTQGEEEYELLAIKFLKQCTV